MKHQRITLKFLDASPNPRPLITGEVDRLAKSISEIGLIQPIVVVATSVVRITYVPGWKIVAGHHRVAACRALGWTEIDAIVIENEGHLESELIEIDENLCRAELTISQRTAFTKRRKHIWEVLNPVELEVAHVAPPVDLDLGGSRCATQLNTDSRGQKKSAQQTKGFAAATAEATGQSKATTNRALARSKVLTDEALDKITGTSLDSGVELDALAKLPEPERAELIERAAGGEAVSARQTVIAFKDEIEYAVSIRSKSVIVMRERLRIELEKFELLCLNKDGAQ